MNWAIKPSREKARLGEKSDTLFKVHTHTNIIRKQQVVYVQRSKETKSGKEIWGRES